jgi:hypothetical protein
MMTLNTGLRYCPRTAAETAFAGGNKPASAQAVSNTKQQNWQILQEKQEAEADAGRRQAKWKEFQNDEITANTPDKVREAANQMTEALKAQVRLKQMQTKAAQQKWKESNADDSTNAAHKTKVVEKKSTFLPLLG